MSMDAKACSHFTREPPAPTRHVFLLPWPLGSRWQNTEELQAGQGINHGASEGTFHFPLIVENFKKNVIMLMIL